jgi:hypothetical protein
MLLAYVDPGLGAMAVQALVAGVLGVLFYVTRAWRWVLALGRRKRAGEGQDRARGGRGGEP